MTRQRIDEMKKFIQITEGTWALPNNDNDYEALADLLFGSGGKVDAMEMRDRIYSLYGDDELYNMLDELEDADPNSDARPYVIDWLRKHDPMTFNALYSQGKAQKVSEGFGDKVSGWFFKKGTKMLISEIDKLGPMATASMVMQMPEKKQKNLVQGAKYYLENVEDHPGLRKFVEVMALDHSVNEDLEDGEEDSESFFVLIRDGGDSAVVQLEKEGGYWHENLIFGDAYNIGSKRYMGYLEKDDIIHWLNRDYDYVSEPFDNEWDAEMEMDRMREDEDSLVDEDRMPMEDISLGEIAEEILKDDWNMGDYYDAWDDDEDDAPKTNICPSCEGEGCEECYGEGEIFEDETLSEAGPTFDPASVEKFEDALEMTNNVLDQYPERNTLNVFRKAARQAGILDRAEMKQFWIWLDWQGEWTHPSLLEAAPKKPLDDEDDDEFVDPEAIVDVGDDEDFEFNDDEFDLDELGINIDLEDY